LDDPRDLREQELKLDATGVGGQAHRIDGLIENRSDVDQSGLEHELSRDGAGEIREVGHQPDLVVDGPER
jgi:hypothetical protein